MLNRDTCRTCASYHMTRKCKRPGGFREEGWCELMEHRTDPDRWCPCWGKDK